ncbi:flagellar FlbD family protein [Turicibacter sanguinis]|uniref:flagellar FlbD family protein n=1 Tax=Turicibacter sanguinis TaxID=154288 RepID=UPI0018AC6D2F|nr:flagellar FlbD family protein [Turicibacter sanguinis]MDB8551139.1 flagellar FlbD family protein [Turicibacter sanguinis]
MILLHKLNTDSFYLNCHLIEKIEENPDTVITLVDGKTIRVCETAKEVVESIKTYRKEINR